MIAPACGAARFFHCCRGPPFLSVTGGKEGKRSGHSGMKVTIRQPSAAAPCKPHRTRLAMLRCLSLPRQRPRSRLFASRTSGMP
jgi:hypothetical protein